MAKRISALFSSKDDDRTRYANSAEADPSFGAPATPPRKLTKPMTQAPSHYDPHSQLYSGLEAPPSLVDPEFSSRPLSRDGRSGYRSDTGDSRQSSASRSSRPQTPTMLTIPGTASPLKEQSPNTGKLSKRKSWIPGRSDRQSIGPEPEGNAPQAWIAGLRESIPYDISPLLNGQPVSDLWDNQGDILVHLFPETTTKGPSFRVSSSLFADSRALSYLTHPLPPNGLGRAPYNTHDLLGDMGTLSLQDPFGGPLQPGLDPYDPTHASTDKYSVAGPVRSVHLPLNMDGDYSAHGSIPRGDDLELVVLYRNFFAFLCGGALVATHRQSSLYTIFMSISSILSRLQYGNEKGSSWGDVPWHSFSRYTEELRLGDVRSSREKNIEAILIGVAMRSWPLYNEGFVHAVGRLDDIKSIKSPKFDKIPAAIVDKLELASHHLQSQRLQPLHARLDNFYFPSMFSGIANSQTATEAKLVKFKAWKQYFMDFRQYTMAQYKRRYGNWPPKASSKKNSFDRGGLNRLLLREVYEDFTNLYDMLVDRTSMTTRTTEVAAIADDAESGSNETIQHALRSVESEYDRSVPPVAPPIPFDVPIIPAFERQMLAKDAQSTRKLRDSELNELLFKSYNRDSLKSTTWIQDFIEYERRLCQGKTIEDLVNVRCGQWLFIYAVLQALPMTVVDARDLTYTEGVEYFLSEAPSGGRPWVPNDVSNSRAWSNVVSGGSIVSMPAETIDHSIVGIHRRSHCWLVANVWAEALGPLSPVTEQATTFNYFPAPELVPAPFLSPAAHSPARRSPAVSPYASPLLQPTLAGADVENGQLPRISSRTSMNLGLEEFTAPSHPTRPVSNYNPNITFDNIIASQNIKQKPARKPRT